MKEILMALEEVLRAEALTVPEEYVGHVSLYALRYRSDECEVEGFVCIPSETTGPWPVLIFNRGGNREFGALTGDKLCKYAVRGYAVFASQYRGCCGGTGKEEFGGRDVYDVIHLTDIALKLPFTRKEGVYMLGRSRGGLMTYRACTLDNRIRAAVVCCGVADSVMMYETREDGMKQVYHELVGGSPKECPEAFRLRSPVCWADEIMPPILICQGTNDWRVVPEQAYGMDRALEYAGKEHKLIIYEGADHAMANSPYVEDAMTWFAEHPL